MTPLWGGLARRWGVLDIPSQRKMHRDPTPLLGGIAVYLAFSATSLMFLKPVIPHQMALLLLGGAAFGIIGLLDDLWNAGAWKLAVEAIVVVAIVWLGGFSVELPWPYLGHILAILWIVGVANAFNCLDSTDGVASGTAVIAGVAITILAISAQRWGIAVGAAAVAGAALGFLRYNFPPARIFLGDAGSLTLGFILAALSAALAVNQVSVVHLFALVVIMGLPVFDFLLVHVKRYRNGLKHPLKILTSTGKDHLPHRLLDRGFSQQQAALWVYRASALLGASGIVLFLSGSSAVLVLLILFTMTPYLVERRTRRVALEKRKKIAWEQSAGAVEVLAPPSLTSKP